GVAADHLRGRDPGHRRARDAPRAAGGVAMRIIRIETFTVGAGWKNWLFVRVHTDDGLSGVGEGTLNGFVRTIEAAVRELEHLAIGEETRRVTANEHRQRVADS